MPAIWLKYPTVERNVPNANGYCGHGMIPRYCVLCNPLKPLEKIRKVKAAKLVIPEFMFAVIDLEDDEPLCLCETSKEAFAEMEALVIDLGNPENYMVKVVPNPEHPDFEEIADAMAA